jgi:hypothetical protein
VRKPTAALALLALIGAGCSNAPSETAAPSRDKAAKFSQCMRDHGVSAFPDPDASGELTIDGVLNGSSLDPDSPAWKQAWRACKQLEPPGFTGDHDVSDEQQEARLAFARCIRENGVEDFPDPARDAPLVDTRRIPSASTEGGMTILNAAMQKCRESGAKAIGQ